jgi:hypothetical protein
MRRAERARELLSCGAQLSKRRPAVCPRRPPTPARVWLWRGLQAAIRARQSKQLRGLGQARALVTPCMSQRVRCGRARARRAPPLLRAARGSPNAPTRTPTISRAPHRALGARWVGRRACHAPPAFVGCTWLSVQYRMASSRFNDGHAALHFSGTSQWRRGGRTRTWLVDLVDPQPRRVWGLARGLDALAHLGVPGAHSPAHSTPDSSSGVLDGQQHGGGRPTAARALLRPPAQSVALCPHCTGPVFRSRTSN